MSKLLKTGCWTAAIAGFLFAGADLYAQRRGFVRPPVMNANVFRQQSMARPFTPAMQASGFNTNFFAQQNMARSFTAAPQPVFNANLYRQQSLTRPIIPATQPRVFNNAFTNPALANFYRTSYYNPYLTGFANPYFGYGTFNPAGVYNPYLNYPTYAQGGFYNPYAGTNLNATGFYNPYAFPGSLPQPAPFAPPFYGY